MYQINFTFNSEKISFVKKNVLSLYMEILNWLHDNNYSFKGRIHEKFIRKIHTIDEIENIIKTNNSYKFNDFYNISDSGNFIYRGGNINKIYPNILMMLENFGVDKSTIKTEGFETQTRIKKFGEIDISNNLEGEIEMVDNIEVLSKEPIENIKIFSKNPFRQSICVLGGSGAGKSTTIENILDEEDHKFEFIIPSASTTGLLSQFSPSKSGYVPSKLGKMIVNAYNNPTQLFTAVFDECHKSNVIEMINDELLQAISIKRNNGKRFISLDDDTAELYPGTEKSPSGNILIPNNLGFIFISSKPDVIIHNDDFFNRIDIVQLKSYEEERLTNIEELLSKTLSNEEKESLKSNND